MRTCLFCDQRADSREDAWPRWIGTQFRASQPVPFTAERRGKKLVPWRVLGPELKIRCVCKTCNNGWMSRLEMQAQAILQPLLLGEPRGLDFASQGIIALWAVKTAMVLEALDAPDQRAYSAQECVHVKSFGAIPQRTVVWIAASNDPGLFMSAKISHRASCNSNAITGLSTTISLSLLVLQVFTIRVPSSVTESTKVTADAKKGPWRGATLRLWPSDPHNSVAWPPAETIDGMAGIERLTERFITSDLDPSELEIVAL